MKTKRILQQLMVVLTLGLLMPLQARAALETISIGGKSFYVLRSETDWNSFCQKVADANHGYDVNAIMAADFTISNFCGDHVEYRGVFDGNGHTLTAALNKNVTGRAPFSRLSSCSFVLGAKQEGNMKGVYENDIFIIHIPTVGQDPHGVAIPCRWQWPTETTCIKDAYKNFSLWASDRTKALDWYKYPEVSKVYSTK